MAQAAQIRRTVAAGAVLLLSCALAACGGSSSPSPSSSLGAGSNADTAAVSVQYRHAVEYARCMRARGVPNFPDPKNPGGFSQAALNALNTDAPAYVTATKVCRQQLPNAGMPTPSQSEGTLVNAVKVAKCMRAHGVYTPDPTLQPNGQLEINMANVNPNQPDLAKVGNLCEKKVYGYSS